MRRSWRFFSSCSSSSVIVLASCVEQKIFAGHAPQDHPLQPVQVVKTVAGSLPHGSYEWFAWILPHELQQLPQGQRDDLAAVLLHSRHIVGQLGQGGNDGFLFRMGIGTRNSLTPWRPVLGQ